MVPHEHTIEEISLASLIGRVEEFKNGGFRLVLVTCTSEGDSMEVTYSFDKDYLLSSIRVHVQAGAEVPSISGMYPGAFIYENEMHNLFGVAVRGMSIDYHGALIRTAVQYPFKQQMLGGDLQ